jgi:methyl halide transferase
VTKSNSLINAHLKGFGGWLIAYLRAEIAAPVPGGVLPAVARHMYAASRRHGRLLTGLLVLLLPCLASAGLANPDSHAEVESLHPCLRSSQLIQLAKSLASTPGAGDSYKAAATLAFDNIAKGAEPLTAFEENRYFVYASGGAGPGVVRRLVILKPSIFVIEDQAERTSQDGTCLYSDSSPSISAEGVRLIEGGSEVFWQSPRPQQVTYKAAHQPAGATGKYLVEASSPVNPPATRSLSVFQVSDRGSSNPVVHAKLVSSQDVWELGVPASERAVRLWLPAVSAGAGEIAVSTVGDKLLLDRQPLPSGILPHGPEGNRLLESWDADYRGAKPPAWDIGRPADELQKAVNEGTVPKCRAVDLCCGSGTDAVFLAAHGFDVTAIDVAPTALAQAKQKANKAGVSVRWVLADVLNPPSLNAFDFLYDRGCYHVVRDQSLAAYLETVRRISRPGSQFLLLSARREEQAAAGSPGVTEEELRYDFFPLFDVEWLRAIRLESNEPGSNPPGWCALLRRSAKL